MVRSLVGYLLRLCPHWNNLNEDEVSTYSGGGGGSFFPFVERRVAGVAGFMMLIFDAEV